MFRSLKNTCDCGFSKLIKCLLKSLGQSNVLKCPTVVLNQGFLTHLLGGNCAPFPTPSSPDKAITITPIKSPLNKRKRWHSTAD